MCSELGLLGDQIIGEATVDSPTGEAIAECVGPGQKGWLTGGVTWKGAQCSTQILPAPSLFGCLGVSSFYSVMPFYYAISVLGPANCGLNHEPK